MVRHLAGQHLEEHDPERIDVRAFVHHAGRELLRRAVLGVPETCITDRDSLLGPKILGDSEIEHLDDSLVVDHQVVALDVSVHDPVLMDERECLRHSPRDEQRLGHGEAAMAIDDLRDRPTANELGRQVVDVAPATHGVDSRDVGMIEPGEDLDLGKEAADRFAIAPGENGKDLQSHESTRADVPRLEDETHSALAGHAEHVESGKLASYERLGEDRPVRAGQWQIAVDVTPVRGRNIDTGIVHRVEVVVRQVPVVGRRVVEFLSRACVFRGHESGLSGRRDPSRTPASPLRLGSAQRAGCSFGFRGRGGGRGSKSSKTLTGNDFR